MISIGIISIDKNTYYYNYGAILHSWAFQRFLNKKCDYATNEIIDYITPKLENWDINNPWKNFLKTRNFRTALRYLTRRRAYKIRQNKILSFIKNKMGMTKKTYTQELLSSVDIPYDILICESDVVWSKGFWDPAFFMAFENMKKSRKIAYSPSMSDCDITEEQKAQFGQYLSGLDYISARESYAVEFIKKFTEKEVKHVIDPVFLLECSDYDCIVSKQKIFEPYLLMYLPAENNDLLRKSAKEYAIKNKLKIIEISSKLEFSFSHKVVVDAGIEEFLSLIKYAGCIFTNSFHCIAFSLIFKKDFYAFPRSLSGKITDLMKMADLMNRYFVDSFEAQQPIDYERISKQMGPYITNSKEWILSAIKNCTQEEH